MVIHPLSLHEVRPIEIGSYDVAYGRTAILAAGEGVADARAAGPLAYAAAFPLLLTDGDTLSEAASTAMTNLGIEQVIVVGGSAAVSAAVFDAVEADGIDRKSTRLNFSH